MVLPALLVLALLLPPTDACLALPGPVVADYSPSGRFAGHWGVDFGAAAGTEVASVLPGVVTFSGLVVDNLSVTIHDGNGLRLSYSFLGDVAVSEGDEVAAGDVVGVSGLAHGASAWHFSVRVGAEYRDPLGLFGCHSAPGPALWLVSFTDTSGLYAMRRAERHFGRNLRSTSCGSSDGRRGSS